MQDFGILVLMIFSRLSRPVGDNAVTYVLIAFVKVLLFKLVFNNYAV